MAKEKKFITCDGNYAAAHVAYMFSELAAIYPITPSSTMAEYVDEWSAFGKKNLFGERVQVVEMQSEGGAAGALHGALQSGVLATTFTASQGLLLMIPNMYKIAGELLPTVFHVSARTLAAQALSIFGDHSDVMAARQTGFAMLASSGVQEALDMGAVSHLSTLKSRVPFVHFFDGFRTSHEIQKIEDLDQDQIRKMLSDKSLSAFRNRALNPNKPVTRGTAQNPDVFFQAREASNPYYDAVPDIVARYMGEISELTGRHYLPFDYYGDPEAENIVIAMGSVCDTIREVVDMQMANGEKVGLLTVRLYRPFSAKYFFRVLPKTVKRIAVLDRTKEPGAVGEPLYVDVKTTIAERGGKMPLIVGGRYGLSSKDTTPAQMVAVFENLKMKEPKNGFTVGIVDDISFKSLPVKEDVSVSKKGVSECKFYGLGSDGTVGANKNTIKIIGETTPKYVQAYFDYDSKKSGGYTCSHLRFGDTPITSPYLVSHPDFVACHVTPYLTKYNVLKGIKKGGTFLLNTLWTKEETLEKLPDFVKATIAKKELKFYIINATMIAEEIGLGNRTNTILQSAFFKIANIIPYEQAVSEMKHAAEKSYGRKGEKVLTMNYQAIDRGSEVVEVEVPCEWKNITSKFRPSTFDRLAPDWVRNVADVVNAQEGNDLPVSAFLNLEDGTIPSGTAAYEKRGIATHVPEWQQENCIQCNQCAYVCPHAAIRPFLMTEEEQKNAPAGVKRVPGNKPFNEYSFTIQVTPMDCTGCGNCADVCPAKEKALVMKPFETQVHEQPNFDHMHSV
ncbi:MAG: pyruvate:ferredoxin (flavodoxin) oxidoreductase, partial [Bacteroidales bacterium]